ncbi:MAG: type II toxin-antitoxin system RelE/ParE family toxin [Gammaproteobacteria bacterium]|nr:type II toxin-antitoxin system RelE/ParE family toxin [Gammaproteobacteria bacterium]
MKIRNIRHKRLRNFIEKNHARGLPQKHLGKITDIIAYLAEIEDINEVLHLQKYKPHLLSGDRAGTYSFHVTANWRITFQYDADNHELYDVDYEDYHQLIRSDE